MAWIRWRGSNAHLMTTERRPGHAVQRYLTSLGGAYSVSTAQRAAIEARYPHVSIDWAARRGFGCRAAGHACALRTGMGCRAHRASIAHVGGERSALVPS